MTADTGTFCYHAAKKHPLTSYGEDYLNCFQAAVVSYQILAYQGRVGSRAVIISVALGYCALVAALANLRRLLHAAAAEKALKTLMTGSMCIFIAARWPQIVLNFRECTALDQACRCWHGLSVCASGNRGVGQLNIWSTAMYLFGNCIRIYTTATQLDWDLMTMTSSSFSAGA